MSGGRIVSMCELRQGGAEKLFEGAPVGRAELFQRSFRSGWLIAKIDQSREYVRFE
jgi:hypothetical protein